MCQINRFREALGSNIKIQVDSHTHTHMIPFIMNIILELAEKESISFIRMPYEKFYLSKKDLRNYYSSNIIKHLILNFLSFSQIKKIKDQNINTNAYFIGVISTGRMTASSAKTALKRLKRRKGASIEILFHPGGIKNKDMATWTDKNTFRSYYASSNRKSEAIILKSSSFKELINSLI